MPTVRIEDLIIPKFDAALFDILEHGHTDYSFPGGRGGTKSSFIGTAIPLLITQNPGVHAMCFRRYANTLRDSVYSQIMTGISNLCMSHLFHSKVSPLEITYKPTGQRIMFRGFDEPEKIKSVKIPGGYIGITWFEELDQFPGRKELRKATQSTRRGGERFWNFESYNPPISNLIWVNQDLMIPNSRRLITWSNYKDVPEEWLGSQFIEDAEHLKEIDYMAYRHEYLGEAVGTGGNVFDKLEVRDIPNKEIKRFDRIYQGMDFGWFPDPMAFVRLHYDSGRNTVYLIDELSRNKCSNEEAASWIRNKRYDDFVVTCDSAEPKSIYDMTKLGIRSTGAEKGPGSVEYGMKWLQRRKIVIDPKRTPRAFKEFLNYEYERDKEGCIISGYPDKDNHAIDATRYALERVMLGTKTVA
jgi:PBSX family phage terminase large subunit